MENVAGFKFEHRGPVSPAELEAARDVKVFFKFIFLNLFLILLKSAERFTEVAREMIATAEEDGAEGLLAAATTHSLLNSKKGSQTWQMDVQFEIRSPKTKHKLDVTCVEDYKV